MNLRHALYRAKRKDNGEWVYGNLIHRTEFYGTPTDDYLILAEGEFHEDYKEKWLHIWKLFALIVGWKDSIPLKVIGENLRYVE